MEKLLFTGLLSHGRKSGCGALESLVFDCSMINSNFQYNCQIVIKFNKSILDFHQVDRIASNLVSLELLMKIQVQLNGLIWLLFWLSFSFIPSVSSSYEHISAKCHFETSITNKCDKQYMKELIKASNTIESSHEHIFAMQYACSL